MVVLTGHHFRVHAAPILNRGKRDGGFRDDFRYLFGVSADTCSVIWNLCDFPPGTEPKHLLWALLFLKVYGKESTMVTIVGGPTRKTFRKWVWLVIGGIASMVPSVVSSNDDDDDDDAGRLALTLYSF